MLPAPASFLDCTKVFENKHIRNCSIFAPLIYSLLHASRKQKKTEHLEEETRKSRCRDPRRLKKKKRSEAGAFRRWSPSPDKKATTGQWSADPRRLQTIDSDTYSFHRWVPADDVCPEGGGYTTTPRGPQYPPPPPPPPSASLPADPSYTGTLLVMPHRRAPRVYRRGGAHSFQLEKQTRPSAALSDLGHPGPAIWPGDSPPQRPSSERGEIFRRPAPRALPVRSGSRELEALRAFRTRRRGLCVLEELAVRRPDTRHSNSRRRGSALRPSRRRLPRPLGTKAHTTRSAPEAALRQQQTPGGITLAAL